ncbi:MAG TPA: DUF2231 domain-containing protein [Terriglobales bacterium]|nr:DUF2231 domain-containing protein [Terriglobales bacterium]
MRSRASIKSHPLHPMLVAFPIGLLVTSFVFDLISVWRDFPSLWSAAWYCVIAGLIGAVLAAVPGAIDLFAVVPPNSSGRRRGYKHAILNLLVIIAFVAVAAYRGSPDVRPNATSLLLSAIGVVLIGISGWLGATLVYRNQIAVDHRYANASKQRVVELNDWNQPVCKSSDLVQGQIMLAEIQGSRVAVGRCAEGIVAFHDHCTHRGGPLSDGALIGCTVQCPWHGSQFDVHSGRVVNGPAEERILTYDIVQRGDDVFVYPRREERRNVEGDERAA